MISVSPSGCNLTKRKGRESNPQGVCSTGFQPVPVANRVALPFSHVRKNTSTRIRTRNASFEARHDVHFTIEVSHQRKGRDSNPHDEIVARFSKPARQALSDSLPSRQRRPEQERVESGASKRRQQLQFNVTFARDSPAVSSLLSPDFFGD